jgi:N-methylhydantoinase A
LLEICNINARSMATCERHATELRTRGYEPENFTILAYGGNGPLHTGVARAGINRSSAADLTFSAVGAGNMNQLHIHEMNSWTVLFDANQQAFFADYASFNSKVEELERRGRDDLLRQGFTASEIGYRLELDMRYGNQRVQTAVVTDLNRVSSTQDILKLIEQFHTRYGERFGKGSQAPEAGIRVNTIRVCSYVQHDGIAFAGLRRRRDCHFVGHADALETPIYGQNALAAGTTIDGPGIVVTRATTYLIEPGWRYEAAAQGAVWFTQLPATETAS